ncbi:Transposon Tf2-9 polyprotein [Nosema granulosis]|uniref:Transposon Tf2-9 polyprotein n=1 Tax=Nosema granulosis TaxID=83296 RepID=A0A9P6GZV9_9MICR|nr:Transposon Tf2-9 polyprotein [Nosema granulosis]
MDDIVVYSKTKEEHTKHVKQILKVVEEVGLFLNKEKCEFLKTEIQILGHVIDANGVRIDPKRVKSIEQLKIPKTRKELVFFLRMINCCSRFLKNLSCDTSYLYGMIRKDSEIN